MNESEYKKELCKGHVGLTKVVVQKFQQKIREENVKIASREYDVVRSGIVDLPEFKSCIELMTKDPALETFKLTESFDIDEYKGFHRVWLLNFLERPLYRWKGFETRDFEVRYREREACICPEKREYTIIGCFHRSLRYRGEDIDLGDGLRIRQLEGEEATAVSYEIDKFSLGKYVLEIRGTYRCSPCAHRLPQSDFQHKRDYLLCLHAESVCQKVIWAMRLFKDADVNILHLDLSWPSLSVPYHFGYDTHLRVNLYRDFTVYNLSKEEAVDFKNFWQKYHDLMERADLNIALRRFGYLFERVRPEDKLIDCILAFESLFVKERERHHLKDKISQRMLKLLQTNKIILSSFSSRFRDLGIQLKEEEIHEKIEKELRLIYELRNKIVHGWRVGEIDKKLKEFQRIRGVNLNIPLSDLGREHTLKVPASKSVIYLREVIKEVLRLLKEGDIKNVNSLVDYLDKTR